MMETLAPTVLQPVPAPFWFVELFKVLGFCLHLVPMNLWYAGTILAVAAYVRGGMAQRFAVRLMAQLPILIAFGINFGIVPLLFIQLAYHKVFYPATILMAWPWLFVIVLLMVAYHGVYAYSFAVRPNGPPMTRVRMAAGWIAASLFLVIGFLFANALSLMENVAGWRSLWHAHSVAGAATGTALNVGDPAFWPRWLLMFGFALGTTGAWTVVDAAWLASKEGPEYRRWAQGFALKLFMASFGWSMTAGAWYLLGTWSAEVRRVMLFSPWVLLTIVAAASPALPLAVAYRKRNEKLTGRLAVGIALAQVAMLAINAIARQVVQNIEVGRLYDVAHQPLAVQWSPLVAFLLVFAAGLAVIGWMVAQVVRCSESEEHDAENQRPNRS